MSMSLTEEAAAAPEPPEVLSGSDIGTLSSFAPPGGRVLLVWDAPNLDMGLGSILGRRPTALERPRFDALGRWLLTRTEEISASRPGVVVEPEATVFTNIAPGSADVVRPWVDALRNVTCSPTSNSGIRKGSPRWSWPPLTVKRSVNRSKKLHAAGSVFK
jgi:uncharacterized protein